MRCPFCGYIDQKVLDSRPAVDGDNIRRRRECNGCGRRFTTFERPERPRLFVVKRDGTREDFSRDKCLNSMLVACRKRRVSLKDLHAAVDRIERNLYYEADEEISSQRIGQAVMQELAHIDVVAYIRFASVYREFESVEDFQAIVREAQELALPFAQPGLLQV